MGKRWSHTTCQCLLKLVFSVNLDCSLLNLHLTCSVYLYDIKFDTNTHWAIVTTTLFYIYILYSLNSGFENILLALILCVYLFLHFAIAIIGEIAIDFSMSTIPIWFVVHLYLFAKLKWNCKLHHLYHYHFICLMLKVDTSSFSSKNRRILHFSFFALNS